MEYHLYSELKPIVGQVVRVQRPHDSQLGLDGTRLAIYRKSRGEGFHWECAVESYIAYDNDRWAPAEAIATPDEVVRLKNKLAVAEQSATHWRDLHESGARRAETITEAVYTTLQKYFAHPIDRSQGVAVAVENAIKAHINAHEQDVEALAGKIKEAQELIERRPWPLRK